jgi:hypothetical protein
MPDTGASFGILAFLNQQPSLIRAIATQIIITCNFPTNARFLTCPDHRYFSLVKSCFRQGRNLVSFFMRELFITHCAPLSCRSETTLNNKVAYPQTISLRLTLTN